MKKLVIFQWVEGGRVIREERIFAANTEQDIDNGIEEYRKEIKERTSKVINIFYPKNSILE